MRDQKFTLVMTSEESQALQALADREYMTKAAVLRRLLWKAADEMKAVDPRNGDSRPAPAVR